MAYLSSVQVMRHYVHYEPGDLVVGGWRSSLEQGVIYCVVSFTPPPEGGAISLEQYQVPPGGAVFVEGARWGQNGENVRLATDEEIAAYFEED